MERFFSSLKTERTARKVYKTSDDAKAHRALLQSQALAFDTGLSQPGGI